jgi:hypothetical protein
MQTLKMWAFLIPVAFLLNFAFQVIKNEKQMIRGLKFLNQISGNEIPGLIKAGFMDNSRGRNCKGNIVSKILYICKRL